MDDSNKQFSDNRILEIIVVIFIVFVMIVLFTKVLFF